MPEKPPEHVILEEVEGIVVLETAARGFNGLLHLDENDGGDRLLGDTGKRLRCLLDRSNIFILIQCPGPKESKTENP